jgi:hypothetical protein
MLRLTMKRFSINSKGFFFFKETEISCFRRPYLQGTALFNFVKLQTERERETNKRSFEA